MFLIKIPEEYKDIAKIEMPFKELSLAYTLELSNQHMEPFIIEGNRIHQGLKEIEKLITELQDYYGADYNCSCAR